ncbi:purine and uridine phosphorylase [Nemania abortiva]|nr:purine and uridine phosphorylase [Nemania abortiva]
MSANPILPPNQHDFKIAIICALTLEAQAVAALFDIHWDNKAYNQAPEDTNTYSVGTIGGHNVVLVHLHNIGKVAAATAAAFLRTCYKGIRLALVVGICGGVPFGESLDKEILMGDVVISDGIIQYDFGSQYPDEFRRKGGVRDNLPRPGPLIRGFLTKLKTSQALGQLEERMLEHLRDLQQEPGNTATYPGAIEDRLFNPTYQHKHHGHPGCSECKSEAVACDEALRLGCEQLGCDEQELVPRVRSMPPSGLPVIHFGLFASGDSVMKSGKERDKVASEDGVIAFEMEGAGLWETFPHCLIIKSVCDYADSHKNKRFQSYAAATAAVTTKAILEIWNVENEFPPVLPPQNHAPIPIDTAPLDPARKGAIFKMLYTSPYRDRKERNPDRVPGTCEWFVSHTSYDRWRTSTSSSMLWVSADPGCGKSVLVKHLVDSELPTTQLRTTCYFFFKDDFTDQRSASGALCCILHQLFKQREVLLSNDIVERFETGEEYLTGSFGELWDILVTASRDENAGEIVCIIDAFDECEEQGRSEFTRYLQKFYGTRNNSNLKFLLTSRPYGNIRRGFEPLELPGLPVIHLSGENEDEMKKIAKEIDIYIKAQVRSIRNILKLKCAEEQILLKELLRVPNRTYIWAHLTLDVVQNDIKLDKAGIYKATSQLPQTVDEAYERILAKSCDSKEARRLLHIVVAAARPLTLSEMELALFLRANHPWNKGFEPLLEERFREPQKNSWFRMAPQMDERASTHESLIVSSCKSASGTYFLLNLRPPPPTRTQPPLITLAATSSSTILPRTGLPTFACQVPKIMR